MTRYIKRTKHPLPNPLGRDWEGPHGPNGHERDLPDAVQELMREGATVLRIDPGAYYVLTPIAEGGSHLADLLADADPWQAAKLRLDPDAEFVLVPRAAWDKALAKAEGEEPRDLSLLPTPMAHDTSAAHWGRSNPTLSDVVTDLLPTPTASDRFGAGRSKTARGGDNLRTVVADLATPKLRPGPS